MFATEVCAKAIVGYAVSVVSSALLPRPMLGLPVARPGLLPCLALIARLRVALSFARHLRALPRNGLLLPVPFTSPIFILAVSSVRVEVTLLPLILRRRLRALLFS